jgi:H+/gluconate symporter-like permease
MGLLGILVGLGLLIWLAFRGWSVLLLAPAAALVAAFFGGEPLLANWTQVFMGSAARFLAQFFPLFLLGAVFGKLMEDSGAVSAVADFMTKRFGERRVMLAVVLAGAFVTYGGVSLFVAFFVLAYGTNTVPRGSHTPAAHAGGNRAGDLNLHDVGIARHAVHSERNPDAVLRHHALRRAGTGHHRVDHYARLRTVVAETS